MKFPVPFLSAVFVAHLALAAGKPIEVGLMKVQGVPVVLVEGTLSSDGRFAGGWTVDAKKGKPPVKWSDYGKEGTSFAADYMDTPDYVITDVIVDLERKVIAAKLQFTEPYITGKNHGALQIAYGPDVEGHRFAVALSDSKWEPNDVVLVDLADTGSVQADVRKTLDAAVAAFVRAHNKKGASGYTSDYQLFSLPEIGLLTGFADGATVRVPFISQVPKSDTAPVFSGTVLLHLSTEKGHPHAVPGEVHQSKKDPEAVADDPRVAAADKELNAAFAALRGKLDNSGKAKLVAEQRDWLKQRDDKVAALATANSDKTYVDNPRIAADRLLLQLTKERTAQLRAR
jgi:uncharacterized protein YecT (DUF1311 family)